MTLVLPIIQTLTEGCKRVIQQTVLVIVAHTDDETLGAGGTIARHVRAGDKVYGLSMTDGVGARGQPKGREIDERRQAALNAAQILGMAWLENNTFPDNGMDSIPLLQVAQAIEVAKRAVKPTLVYTHSPADLNIDHRVVCEATLVAFRPQPKESCKEIRAFEVASATDYGHPDVTGRFTPNLSISIAETWQQKRAALKEYEAEMREAPHSRSFQGLETLAKYRGFQSGLEMAEAFQILRRIET